MGQLLETFCLLDGELLNLPYHSARVGRSLGREYPITPFTDVVSREVSRLGATKGKWRASITYTWQGIESIKLTPYRLPQITSFRLIDIEDNFYSKKWADRSRLDEYKNLLPQGVEPIFVLKGQITDTSFTNILVERDGKLYTPSTPLLLGTKRDKLLSDGTIHSIPLSSAELHTYERIHPINAMLDPGEVALPLSVI